MIESLDLEMQCPSCVGRKNDATRCYDCKDERLIPTKHGRLLLQFLGKHLFVSLPDEEGHSPLWID